MCKQNLPNTSAMQSPLVMYSINALVSRDQISVGLKLCGLICLFFCICFSDQPEEWLVLVLLVELLSKLSGESQTFFVNQSEASR